MPGGDSPQGAPCLSPAAAAPVSSVGLAARYRFLIAIFAFVVVSDQVTKGLAVGGLTNAFEHYGRQTMIERVAGFYSLSNLDNEPSEQGKADVRRRAVEVVPGFWNHKYVENPGAAWGLLAKADPRFRVPFFHLVSLAAIAFILAFYRRVQADQRLLAVALSLVLGGAVGNYVDRIARNYVIDFIDWHWKGQHWPTFNVADAAISVGVALMLFDAIFGHRSIPAAVALSEPTAAAPEQEEPIGSALASRVVADEPKPAGTPASELESN